jgi:hypothetical protein
MMTKERILALMKDKLDELPSYFYNTKFMDQKETHINDSLDENEQQSDEILD